MEIDERLRRRYGLLEDMEYLLKEVTWVKAHQDDFRLPKYILWVQDSVEGKLELSNVDRSK